MRTLAKLTWIELKLFLREPLSLVFTLLFPLVVLVVLVGSFDPADTAAFGGLQASDYYLSGYVGVVISAIGLIAVPVHIAAYRERGVLRRFRASSVQAWASLGAQLLVGLIMAAAASVVLVAAGRVIYDAALPAAPGRVALAFTLATLAFLAMGLLLGTVVPNARAAQGVGMLLFFPMWLLGGGGPPAELMGDGMQTAGNFLPLTYAIDALKDPWLGVGSSTVELLLLAAILLVAGTLSIRTLRAA